MHTCDKNFLEQGNMVTGSCESPEICRLNGCAQLRTDLREANVRGSTHGNFRTNAAITLGLRAIFRGEWEKLDDQQRLALDEIALKIARILSGGADVAEHWIDIAGYSKLGEKACKR